MGKLLGFMGGIIGSYAGWWMGESVGIMTAFMLSTILAGAGIYLGRRVANHYS